jgi:hypothetical protein
MITSQNRFQITHASVALFGPGKFVIFDLTGEEDSIVVHTWENAVEVRDDLRYDHSRLTLVKESA